MKKIFLICLAGVCACSVWAADKPAFYAEDFLNQSLIYVQSSREAKQCQAARIAPNWYLTAAHCVRPMCDKECSVTFELLPGALQASATVWHTSSSPHVFTPRHYRVNGGGVNIRHDIALVRFDVPTEDHYFYDVRGKKPLTSEEFLKVLDKSEYSEQSAQWDALKTANPRLLSIANTANRRLTAPLAVPDLRHGGIYFISSGDSDFYYFTQLRHYLGKNFGVERGLSGSAVIVPGGEIVGVVSASLNGGQPMVIYDEQDRPVSAVDVSWDYFLFTPLNQQNMSFIRATMASFKGRGERSANITGRYAKQTDLTLQEAFPELPPAREIAQIKEQ